MKALKSSPAWLLICGITSLAPSLAYAGLGAQLNVSWGLGKTEQSGNLESRTVNVASFGLLGGYWLGPLLVGADFTYFLVGQNTDPATLSNTNVKGSGYKLGPGISLHFGDFFVAGTYTLFSKYSFSLLSAGNETLSYQKPALWRVSAGMAVLKSIHAFAFFESAKFKQETLGSSDLDVSAQPLTQTSYGLGLSFPIGYESSRY